MRRKSLAAAIVMLVLLCAAIPASALSITLNKTSTNLGLVENVNDTGTLTATVSPKSKAADVVWQSLNESVVTVSQNGELQAVSMGTTKVTATVGSKKAVCTVKVSTKPVRSVTLNRSSATLYIGRSTLSLKYTLSPQYPDNPTVSWTSSDPSVASVSQDGVVLPVSKGKAVIWCSATDGSGKKAKCTVTVKPVTPTKVTLSESSLQMLPGAARSLSCAVLPEDATDKSVKWTSSKPAVVAVDENGNLTALKNGTATITCTTLCGNKTAKCTVKVADQIVPTKVTLSDSSLQMLPSTTKTLTCAILPEDSTNQSVKWISSNSKVAQVDQDGNITAIKNGTVTITCKTQSGAKTAKCTVKVGTIIPTKVTLTETALELCEGETHQMVWSILPEDSVNQNVKWSSSNTKVLTVDENGIITPIKKGTATVTCRTVSGLRTAKCAVTVYTVLPESITLTDKTLKLALDTSQQLNYSILPERAVNKQVTWSSSEPDVATVDENGIVTAHSVGTTTITCKAVANGLTTSCTVSVGYYNTTFRAMVIGQTQYNSFSKLYSSTYDAKIMQNLLNNSTVTGVKYAKVDKRINQTSAAILSALDEMAAWGTKETDVTVFYYSGHGTVYNGESCILGVDYSSSAGNRISMSTVKKKLDALKGTVIIIFDSCYSGGMVDLLSKGTEASPQQFNSAVVSVFAQGLQTKGDAPTYYVLTACTSEEESYTDNGEYKQGSFFTRFMGQGAGYSATSGLLSTMAADTNKDGMCTLTELYAYAKPHVAQKLAGYEEARTQGLTQTVSIYPVGCAFPLLGRN